MFTQGLTQITLKSQGKQLSVCIHACTGNLMNTCTCVNIELLVCNMNMEDILIRYCSNT